MPRRKPTTKTSVKSRRSRSKRTQRLKESALIYVRRFGKIAAMIILALWLGAWLFLSDTAQRGGIWLRQEAYELAGSAGFSVQNILVEGRIHSDADVLRALINIEKGDPIFAFDPDDAKAMIERVAWVKEAHVERRLPDTIYIGLIERTPMALWQHKKKIRVIDFEGVTLTDRKLAPYKDLIILVGEQAPEHAPELLGLIAAEPALKERVEAASWIGNRRWDLKMKKSGMIVKLPEADPGFALRRLAQAQEEDNLLDKDLTVIDLRQEHRIIVRTRPGAVQEYKIKMKGDAI